MTSAGNSWTTGAAYPMALSFVDACAQGNFIYAGGGLMRPPAVEALKTYRYDPGTNTWDDLAIADLPATRWARSTFYNCCPNNGGVLAGGYSGGFITKIAIIWDLASNTWSNLNQMGENAPG